MGLIRRLCDYMIVLNQGQLLEEGKPEDVLQKTMDQYNAADTEIDDICEKIIDVTVNAGKILKSPIISLKRDFLRLILSDFFTDGKNVVFSITKPFDKLLRTAQINKWCAIVCDYRTNFYDEYKQLGYKLELLLDQKYNYLSISAVLNLIIELFIGKSFG